MDLKPPRSDGARKSAARRRKWLRGDRNGLRFRALLTSWGEEIWSRADPHDSDRAHRTIWAFVNEKKRELHDLVKAGVIRVVDARDAVEFLEARAIRAIASLMPRRRGSLHSN